MSCYLYVMVADSGDSEVRYFKIGISDNVASRVASVQTGCPIPITQVMTLSVGGRSKARSAEKNLHRVMQEFRTCGEWFKFDLSRQDHKDAFNRFCRSVLDAEIGSGWSWTVRSTKAIEREMRLSSSPNQRLPTGAGLVSHAYRVAKGLPLW